MEGAIERTIFSTMSPPDAMARNLASSSGVNTAFARPAPSCCTSSPSTRRYGVRMATAPTCPLPALLNTDDTPSTCTRVPGGTRSTRWRSTDSSMCRGISPVGTSSGASCSLSVCWSTYVQRSASITYGSTGHLSAPGAGWAWHVLGSVTAPNALVMGIVMACWQLEQRTATLMALARVREALMTMPGTRTRRLTSEALISRMRVTRWLLWKMSWKRGSSDSSDWSRNTRSASRMASSNSGTYSAGCRWRASWSSALKPCRWFRSASRKCSPFRHRCRSWSR
mmetsp:Transcript_29320/g.95698  ORF Transcript_29320/g.95698 Transcript_29320/m.95698 type:complete len:282 (-) Transcript_29320:169-1014(-)